MLGQFRAMGKDVGYAGRLLGFESQVSQAVWSWETDLASLCFRVLFKMGSTIIPGTFELIHRECFTQDLQIFSTI